MREVATALAVLAQAVPDLSSGKRRSVCVPVGDPVRVVYALEWVVRNLGLGDMLAVFPASVAAKGGGAVDVLREGRVDVFRIDADAAPLRARLDLYAKPMPRSPMVDAVSSAMRPKRKARTQS